ncbi:ATP-binding protein [Halomonas sp. LR3S48]|uniref:ATP-binding protein n=1 Tax=Halomonas sp. LR3S48 TaxID=2982694 RepID=UPI0021E3E334|nr:ATP-binding protein [Halomonas sp. LR3S48]UYG04381.1 ATP-binding protein [Halomonas sp. LR3S48]
MKNSELMSHAEELVVKFKELGGFYKVDYEILDRVDGGYLVIFLSHPTEKYFRFLNIVMDGLSESNFFKSRATIKKRGSSKNRLELPEVTLLRKFISESLTASRNSVTNGDFSERYIATVEGLEHQIISKSNHAVFGRRGSGKSSLMLYSVNLLEKKDLAYSWLPMQTYSDMTGNQLKASVVSGVLLGMANCEKYESEIDQQVDYLEEISSLEEEKKFSLRFNSSLAKVRRLLSKISREQDGLFLFLDDFHVIDEAMQPEVLSNIYSLARDNGVFIKFSGVESFTRVYDSDSKKGLEAPHDVQMVNLDRNLTMPHKSHEHIKKILDSYALYCALPNISYICGDGVIERLVWVAAGVPRDALNLFSEAASKSMIKDQIKVSVTSVNAAASEMADAKIKDIEKDVTGRLRDIRGQLDKIKTFCVNDKKKNAFLVERRPDIEEYKLIESLIGLRFLHVLHEGITPSEAGRRYKALMLDYGFYVGVRAARSVDLFQKVPDVLTVKELRNLPVYDLSI